MTRFLPFLGAVRASTSARVAEVRRRIVALDQRTDRALLRVLEQLERQRERLVARLASQVGSEFDQAVARDLLRATERELEELIAEIEPLFRDHYLDALRRGDEDTLGYAVQSLPPSELVRGFAAVDESLVYAATELARTRAKGISNELASRISSALVDAASGSSGFEEVAREIGVVFKTADRDPGVFGSLATQVERATRTETGRLYQRGQELRIEKLDGEVAREVLKGWVTIKDGRQRKTHDVLNGSTIPHRERFIVGTEDKELARVSWERAEAEGLAKPSGARPASGPHDSTLPAREVLQCRCTLVPRFGAVRDLRLLGRN